MIINLHHCRPCRIAAFATIIPNLTCTKQHYCPIAVGDWLPRCTPSESIALMPSRANNHILHKSWSVRSCSSGPLPVCTTTYCQLVRRLNAILKLITYRFGPATAPCCTFKCSSSEARSFKLLSALSCASINNSRKWCNGRDLEVPTRPCQSRSCADTVVKPLKRSHVSGSTDNTVWNTHHTYLKPSCRSPICARETQEEANEARLIKDYGQGSQGTCTRRNTYCDHGTFTTTHEKEMWLFCASARWSLSAFGGCHRNNKSPPYADVIKIRLRGCQSMCCGHITHRRSHNYTIHVMGNGESMSASHRTHWLLVLYHYMIYGHIMSMMDVQYIYIYIYIYVYHC